MKKIYREMILSLILLSVLMMMIYIVCVKAEGKSVCSTVTYYSQKEWIKKSDFYDVGFDDKTAVIINSQNLSSQINAFGSISFPKHTNYSVITGSEVTTGDYFEGAVFKADFHTPIKIDNFSIDIKGATKNIYINPGLDKFHQVISYDKKIVATDEVLFSLNDMEVNSIMITFSDINEGDELKLNSFQVNSYSTYQHIKWTTDYIAAAETRSEVICIGDGTFTPNGTSNTWKRETETIYTPSVKYIDYTPNLYNSTQVGYDVGRSGSNYTANTPAYSLPNVIKNDLGGYAKEIRSWSINGSGVWTRWWSIGVNGSNFPFIATGGDQGVRYEAIPVHWNGNKNAGSLISSSSDNNWCNYVARTSARPCYKYSGHGSNSATNVYDVMLHSYRRVVEPSKRVFDSANYYLVDEKGNNTFLLNSKEERVRLNLNKSGKWKIKAVVKDINGNTGEHLSNLFLIDVTKPYAVFTPNIVNEIQYDDIVLNIDPEDDHSGVKRWRYYLSKDAGNSWFYVSSWFNSGNSYSAILNQTGDWKIKIEIEDSVGLVNTSYSNVYSLIKSDVNALQMYSKVYEPNENNELNARLGCIDCVPGEKVEITLFVDGDLQSTSIEEWAGYKDFVFDYISDNNVSSKLILNLNLKSSNKTSKLELEAKAKTKEIRETDSSSIIFSAVSLSSVGQSANQIDYIETLALNVINEKELYAGEAIKATLKVEYSNDCNNIVDFKCIAGSTYTDGIVNAIYDDGASPAKEDFISSENWYKVPMIYNENKQYYETPDMLVEKISGDVYTGHQAEEVENELIPGGKNWYSNRFAELGEYKYHFIGEEVAINKFAFKFNRSYRLTKKINELYRVRFLDPINPFPNNEEHDQQLLDWINGLDFSLPKYTYTVEEK